jgi:hypothetical protein
MEIGLILKNARLKSYYMMGWILILLNLLALSTLVFTPAHDNKWIYAIIYFALMLFVFLSSGNVKKSGWIDKRTAIGTLLTLAIVIWISFELYVFAALNAFLCFLYYISTRKFEIVVSAKNIIYPSFPSRLIEWKELQNIIIRDGILTIDFKNNKLLQAELELPFNEKKFNEFCQEQLAK